MDLEMDIGQSPPNILMEEDSEVELEIVRPILNDLVSNVVTEIGLNHLQRLVALNSEQIHAEQTKMKEKEMFEDLLAKCISDAVERVETGNQMELNPIQETSSTNMGTIELCVSHESESDEEEDSKVHLPRISIDDSTPRQVAKVMPFDAGNSNFEAGNSNSSEDDEISMVTHQLTTEVILDEGAEIASPIDDLMETQDPLESLGTNPDSNPEPAPTFGLRLRNFAVDPSVNILQNTVENVQNSWHDIQGQNQIQDFGIQSNQNFAPTTQDFTPILPRHPVPVVVPQTQYMRIPPALGQVQEGLMEMRHLIQESRLTYYLRIETESQFAIFTLQNEANENHILKLFVPKHLQNGAIPLIDIQQNKNQFKVIRMGPNNRMIIPFIRANSPQISTATPRNLAEFVNCIRNQLIFSMEAHAVLDYYEQVKRDDNNHEIISHASCGILKAVDLSNPRVPYAVGFFEYLDKLATMSDFPVTAQKREVTARRLFLLSTLGIPIEPNLENTIFLRFQRTVKGYTDALKNIYRRKISNELQKGRNFHFHFPLFPAPASRVVIPHSRTQTGPTQNAQNSSRSYSQSCEICFFKGHDAENLNLHYVNFHFKLRLKDLAKDYKNLCKNCPEVNDTFSEDKLIHHLGTAHKFPSRFIVELKNSLRKLNFTQNLKAQVFMCPFPNCYNANPIKLTLDSLFRHSIDHLHGKLSSDLDNLRKATGVPGASPKCPLENCKFIGPSQIDAINHFAIFHFGVSNYLRSEFERNKQEKAKDMIVAYQKALTGKIRLCHCGDVFESLYQLNLHKAKEHMTGELIEKFKNTCRDVSGPLKVCGFCTLGFEADFDGGIHIGVVHNYVNQQEQNPAQNLPSSSNQVIEIEVITPNQNAPVLWYFQCPICALKINDGNKKSSNDKFVTHLIESHLSDQFKQMLSKMNEFCPVRGCTKKIENLNLLSRHVIKSHVAYIYDFLKKQVSSLNLSECFISLEVQNPLEKYEEFCKNRKIQPYSADVWKVNSFINFAFNELKMPKNDIKTIFEEIEKKHENKKISEDPLIKHTLENLLGIRKYNLAQIHANAAKNQPISAKIQPISAKVQPNERRKSSNITSNILKNFICWTCEKEFSLASELKNHLVQEKHSKIVIGCKFCDFKGEFSNEDRAEKFIILHTFSKAHLHNRFIDHHKKPELPKRKLKMDEKCIKCEICDEVVDQLIPHVGGKKHNERSQVVNTFVGHCDARVINPVTCAVADVNFFLEQIYPKTLMKERKHHNVSFFIFLNVIDIIHDKNIDGLPMSSVEEVAQNLQKLMVQGLKKPFNYFICFTCATFHQTLDDLKKHVNSPQHLTKSLAKEKKFKCEICDKMVKNYYQLELHCYSREHIINSREENAGHIKPKIVANSNVNFCYICQVSTNDESHIKDNKQHKTLKKILDSYLGFCEKNGMNPLDPKRESLSEFFKIALSLNSVTDIKNAFKTWNIERFVGNLTAPVNVTSGTSQVKPGPSGEHKKIESESYGFTNKDDIDMVTKCPKCNMKFKHATYLLYHVVHIHQFKPAHFISDLMDKKRQILTCPRCVSKKCLSPIILALHHDRHQAQGKHLTCPNCRKNFTSPAAFYSQDSCKSNGLPERTKQNVDKVILDALKKYPDSNPHLKGVLGDLQISKQKRPRSESPEIVSFNKRARTLSSSEDEDLGQEDLGPDLISSSSSRASSRASSEIPDFESTEKTDQDREREWASLIKPCSVVIKTRRPSNAKVESRMTPKAGPKTSKITSFFAPKAGPSSSRINPKAGPSSSKMGKKPGPKSKNLTPKKEIFVTKPLSINLKKPKGLYFCLDCEQCKLQDCSHENHARKLVEKVDKHMQDFAHGRYQRLKDFFKTKPKVSLVDLAFDKNNCAVVRKKYKRYTKENLQNSPVSLFDYEQERKCKMPDCQFVTQSIVYMFRHIREEHFEEQD